MDAAATFLPPATIIALMWFTLVNSITPGPNNIMLATSGVNFGVRRTVPQMAGVFTGLLVITVAIGLGLGAIFSEYPVVRDVLRVAGIGYILFLAWKIATSGSLGGGELPHPMRYSLCPDQPALHADLDRLRGGAARCAQGSRPHPGLQHRDGPGAGRLHRPAFAGIAMRAAGLPSRPAPCRNRADFRGIRPQN